MSWSKTVWMVQEMHLHWLVIVHFPDDRKGKQEGELSALTSKLSRLSSTLLRLCIWV